MGVVCKLGGFVGCPLHLPQFQILHLCHFCVYGPVLYACVCFLENLQAFSVNKRPEIFLQGTQVSQEHLAGVNGLTGQREVTRKAGCPRSKGPQFWMP